MANVLHPVKRVRIRFGSASYGWLGGSIQIEDQAAAFKGSHTPVNWLLHLVWALGAVAARRELVEIAINAEPQEYRLSFVREDHATRLHVTRVSPRDDPETLMEAPVPTERLLLAFWRGLRNLESRMGPASEHWQHEFPRDALRQLQHQLRP